MHLEDQCGKSSLFLRLQNTEPVGIAERTLISCDILTYNGMF